MAGRQDLMNWIADALRDAGGGAKIAEVAKRIWSQHEKELRTSGDLFYTWQYDMRWAAKKLRDQGILVADGLSPRGTWELCKSK
jgi:hypothetical protein